MVLCIRPIDISRRREIWEEAVWPWLSRLQGLMWNSNSSWNILRRRREKTKNLEEKPLEVLRVAVGATENSLEQLGLGQGDDVPLPVVRECWGTQPRDVTGSEVTSLKSALLMRVRPAKSVSQCLTGWGRSWWYTPHTALSAIVLVSV